MEVEGGGTQHYAKDVNKFENCGYYDKTKKKMQDLKREGRRDGGCLRHCSIANCMEQQ